jgi:hypothetical protein
VPGQVALHLSWLGTYAHATHDDHDDVVGRGEIDLEHDQRIAVTEARLGVDVGLPRGFGASLVVPARLVATTIRYLDGDGMVVALSNPGIHHRDETLTGLGDPMVLGSFAHASGAWRVSGRAGLTIPLGRTEENPFALGDLGLRHEHVQMGTGTFNPVLAVEVARTWGRWRLGGFGFTQQTLDANGKGYQAGDRYAGGVTLRRRIGARWTLRAGGEVQAETAERWDGDVPTDDGNRGRFDAMLAGGASWSAAPGRSLDLGVKVPVVTHVVGGQLDLPAIVELGASWTFGGRAAPARRDAAVVEPDALVPVPGKITIVDYWAAWCEACKVHEPALVALVGEHPDTLALRRVDVTGWDDYPWAMPHVTILDASGATLFDDSSRGDLDAFVADSRAAVEPGPAGARRVRIVVTEAGFEPAHVTVPVDTPVVLELERTTDATCATEIVLEIDGARITRALPLGQIVELPVRFTTRGVVGYACGMDMIHGTITVE